LLVAGEKPAANQRRIPEKEQSMKISTIVVLGVTAAALATAGACGGSSGRLVIGIKDGPPTSSDGRTITKLEIDITKIELQSDGENEQAGEVEDKDVVVFDAGTGAVHTVDLLKVTTFSELIATVTVPAGTYGEAEVTVNGARVVFADAPSVTVPLVLEGDGKSKAEFDFHFKPAAVVTGTGTTLAVIDFVPVVIKDGAGQYRLGHDGMNDHSGEGNEHDEFEVEGSIATLDLAANKLTLSGSTVTNVDFSSAKIEVHGVAATKAALAKGQKVEVEGTIDKATGALIATKIEVG
jgi:hypothetical protein